MNTPSRHRPAPPPATLGWRRAAASGGAWFRQRDNWLMLIAVTAILTTVGGTLLSLWVMFRLLTHN